MVKKKTLNKATKKSPLQNCFSVKTRSKSKANILPDNCEHKRSKSKKKEIITIDTTLNQQNFSSVSTRSKSKAIILPNNCKNTRSESAKIEIIDIDSDSNEQNFSSVNTRSKSKTNILPKNFENTLPKSKKTIDIDTNSNQQQQQNSDDKPKTQTKSLCSVKKQYVKLHDFKVDSVVLAKQKYSVPWPSKVLKIERERVFVYFFGDKRSGYVPKNEIYDFILSVNAIKSTIASKKNHRSYTLGIAEIEMLMGIKSENSLLN